MQGWLFFQRENEILEVNTWGGWIRCTRFLRCALRKMLECSDHHRHKMHGCDANMLRTLRVANGVFPCASPCFFSCLPKATWLQHQPRSHGGTTALRSTRRPGTAPRPSRPSCRQPSAQPSVSPLWSTWWLPWLRWVPPWSCPRSRCDVASDIMLI